MTKKIIIICGLLFCLGLIGLYLLPVQAQTTTLPTFKNINEYTNASAEAIGLNTDVNFPLYVAQIIQLFLGIVGTLFVVMIIYGGVLWMTGNTGADKNKIDKAKKVLVYSIIGLVIIFAAYAITSLVAQTMEQAGQTQPSTPVQ